MSREHQPMKSPRRIDDELQKLYDQVPDPGCTGACHGACCFAPASKREQQRMERVSGKPFRTIDAQREAEGGLPMIAANARPMGDSRVGRDGRLMGRYRCSMLTSNGFCSVHEHRPMICRLYGAAEGLECDRGCRPEGGLLPFDEGMRLLSAAIRVGGEPEGFLPEYHELLSNVDAVPGYRELLTKLRRSGNWKVNRSST